MKQYDLSDLRHLPGFWNIELDRNKKIVLEKGLKGPF